ncbi:hypothetical protein PVAND_009986 [Polypedilum vanderplanki]|uniref:HMG box domain-containing protein n=1 Tax=Polypedilum vanderplanki TaxID=319348 RepID=A0A9J6CFT7_POLVA|nr:hypothetical protein PVAND_009986 [Polypedilum vanderplanki]
MLSNMNQQTMDTSILYFNSHATKNPNNNNNNNNSNEKTKEFSIYRPDVDFSINYEPIGLNERTRLVNDAKDSAVVVVQKSTTMTQQNGDLNVNGRRAVMMSYGNEYPTNLHNYSKVPESITMMMIEEDVNSDRNNNSNNNNNRSISSSSGDSRDLATSDADDENIEDTGNRDDNNNASNKIDDKKPEHHVRRPMNAFLIFCKRHRALVREKYPNLENRSITKILGDWWAFLPNEDKLPYKDLAKNYKDVFFSKNPNFKWYKLPAPPLRTLSTRPSNERDRATSPIPITEEIVETSPKDRAARNIKPITLQNHSGIGQFKLASIDQMGGLSSLMMVEPSSSPRSNGSIYGDIQQQTFVSGTTRDEIHDSQPRKRKSDEAIDTYDEELTGKSRACKGKRYEQFMTPTKKATKQKNTSAPLSSPIATSVHFPHNGYCKPQELSPTNGTKVHHNNNYRYQQQQTHENDSSDEMAHSPESDDINQGDANDFKLNDKIMTLPSLDLEDYLNRKKAMKKKKKFSHKTKHRQQQNAQAAQSKEKVIPKQPAAAIAASTAVGSQKRKAPKQTIRRTADIVEPPQQEISRVGLIGLDTLATLALVQANASSPQ